MAHSCPKGPKCTYLKNKTCKFVGSGYFHRCYILFPLLTLFLAEGMHQCLPPGLGYDPSITQASTSVRSPSPADSIYSYMPGLGAATDAYDAYDDVPVSPFDGSVSFSKGREPHY